VIPGADGKVYAVTMDGGDLSGWPVVYSTTSWTESSPVIADIDNDGYVDVILGDETRFVSGWDHLGNGLPGFPLAIGDALRATPSVADFDKDGDVDLIAAGWDKAVHVWDFPDMFNPHLVPWGSYRGNLFNDGNTGSELPTGVFNATFQFALRNGYVDLMWQVPPETGYLFHVSRAPVNNGDAGAFVRIATDVAVDADGLVRYTDAGAQPGTGYVYRVESANDPSRSFTTVTVYIAVTRAGLSQNYPNPFNPSTMIEYLVPDGTARKISLVVYDVHGARVRTLVDNAQTGGRHVVEWDGRDNRGNRVSSGIYFYRLTQPGYTGTKKMVLLK
jgi:hypothetical protein